jgi:monoamine oxidase
LSVVTSTAWRTDLWSRGSWAVVPPGFYAIRDTLREPVAQKLWFAGEATSRPQWGTVGGAWAEGERAAEEVIGQLRSAFT